MATKAEERRNTITEHLQANPGAHTADQIAEALSLPASETGRALAQLTRSGTIAETEPDVDGTARWTAAEPDEQQGGDEAVAEPDAAATAAAGEGEALDEDTGTDPAPESAAESEVGDPAAESHPESPGAEDDVSEDQADIEADAAASDEAGPDAQTEGTPAADAVEETASGGPEPEASDDESEPDEGEDGDNAEEDESPEPEPVPDPDPAVLLLAAALPRLTGALTLEAVTLGAFRVAGPKQMQTALYSLCALAAHGAVECSDPYSPDDRDRDDKAVWTLLAEPAELDRIAGFVQQADAPESLVCPTCRIEIELPHPADRPSKPEADPKKPRRKPLANGELSGMLQTLIDENPGEVMKSGQFVIELQNDPRFKHRLSKHPSGAIRSALTTLAKNGWLEDLETMPQSYRCREAK
jgi:hypothetical protein